MTKTRRRSTRNQDLKVMQSNFVAPATESTISPTQRQAMIAEAAYYKAERRGFAPGWELQDWLEAEGEIANQAPLTH